MVWKYPLLVNNSPNMKLSLNEYRILIHCDGFHDISEIQEMTGLPRLLILKTIRKYAKKGKIRMKCSIMG